jgi:hypothetical protein
MSTDLIGLWHERARPKPTEAAFNVQLGCHFEEFGEMLETLVGGTKAVDDSLDSLRANVHLIAEGLKKGTVQVHLPPERREDFLDSLADQVVTAIGTGHCARMRVVEAIRRVNTSNWSKFVDGQPVFNATGKIAKPPGYAPPDLKGLY